MLLVRGKINEDLIRMMGGWRHSGFNVYAAYANAFRCLPAQDPGKPLPLDSEWTLPSADDYLIDPDYPTDSWTN